MKTTRVIFHPYAGTPNGAIVLNFGMQADIADIITHTKCCVNRFRGFGILIPPNLPLSIGLADHSYNSVSTAQTLNVHGMHFSGAKRYFDSHTSYIEENIKIVTVSDPTIYGQ